MNDKSDISKQSGITTQKNFSENFCPVCDSLVGADIGIQQCGEKAHTFSLTSKHVKKQTKTDEKRLLCKSALSDML